MTNETKQLLIERVREMSHKADEMSLMAHKMYALSEDLRQMLNYHITPVKSAHCVKCGNEILGKEDSICENCF
jgi:hypothetical protein